MSPTNPLSKSVLESMGSLDNIHCLRRRLCAPLPLQFPTASGENAMVTERFPHRTFPTVASIL